MITRDNLVTLLQNLSDKDKNRIKTTDKYYIIIIPHIFNAGSYISVHCTNNADYKYNERINTGGCILESFDKIFEKI